MSNLNLQKLREWVWLWPWTFKFWGWSSRSPGFWITLKFSLPLR